MITTTSDVLIVGAGPTGLTLATALVTRGIQTTVVDRQTGGANTSRAAVVHARTLESFLKLLACIPAFRRQLAWRLSGLVYR